MEHGGETVLQTPHGILALTAWYVYLHVAGSNTLRFGEQLMEGSDGLSHQPVTDKQDDEQPYQE